MTELKQVLLVRKDLKMTRGKEGGQCAHATGNINYHYHDHPLVREWMSGSYMKAVLVVDDLETLLRCRDQAAEAGLLHWLQHDQGRTQFKNVHTWTVLAIGPGHPEMIDAITGAFKLR